MEFRIQLQPEDDLAGLMFMTECGPFVERSRAMAKRQARSFRVIGFFMLVVGASLLYTTWISQRTISTISFLIAFFGLIAVVKWSIPGGVERVLRHAQERTQRADYPFNKAHRMHGSYAFAIDSDWLCITGDLCSTTFSCGAIDRIDDRDKYFYISFVNGCVQPIPKRALRPAEIESVRTALQDWWGEELRTTPA